MTAQPVEISAPASKSLSHRAFIAAALAEGESKLSGVLYSDDLKHTRICLEACGAKFSQTDGVWTVRGLAGKLCGGGETPVDLDVGESGTTCRLLAGVVAAGIGRFKIHGRGRMHFRPIGQLASALLSQGVNVLWLEKHGCPPLIIDSGGLPGGSLKVSLEESSQYLSGLLLAAPLAKRSLAIEVIGEKAVSWPYVALTLSTLADFGLDFSVLTLENSQWIEADWRAISEVTPGKIKFVVAPGNYKAKDLRVEGDWSNASYFLAAGALGSRPVAVSGLRPDSLQGDRAILDILGRMGASHTLENGRIVVAPAKLKGINVDMGHCPDLVPTVAVAAAQAEGVTRIFNVAHLKIKESDRLAALATEIAKLGCGVDVFEDGLAITPYGSVPGFEIGFATYDDHRLAMSLSLLELAKVKVKLDNPACVAKSFPDFWKEWDKIR